MDLMYKSTRGDATLVSASQAIINGLCKDGGLYVPVSIPKLNLKLEELSSLSYQETAYQVIKEFLTDFTEEELRDCINKAYDKKFDTEEIAPLVKKGDQYFLELFHGQTIAFKDMALSLLPHLLTTSLKKNNIEQEVVILTATSGDTGKAALAGFADVAGTRIIVFYPAGGVSKMQELQMVTQKGNNTKVVSVRGNFDDCQSGVKSIFNDKEFNDELFEKGFILSSANSINIGRLVPQVAYYVYAYGRMVKMGAIKCGEPLDFVVPTGNFGNILAAYYAKEMGIPVGKLVCASNENKVLFDFFETGIYDRNREFILTTSPSMDILISSNLERLIFHSCGNDAEKNAELMKSLATEGKYEITKAMRDFMDCFIGGYASEQDVFDTIKSIYENCGYVIDTHTAVAAYADKKYKESSDSANKSVVISTASPFKFSRNVMKAVSASFDNEDDFAIADELSRLGQVELPNAIKEIRNADILHNTVCDINEMKSIVEKGLIK